MALRDADAVVFALRLSVLKGVVDEIGDPLGDKSLVAPSNPVGLNAEGKVVRLLPEGLSSGETIANWLPTGTQLAMAFGSLSAYRDSMRRAFDLWSYSDVQTHADSSVERLRKALCHTTGLGRPTGRIVRILDRAAQARVDAALCTEGVSGDGAGRGRCEGARAKHPRISSRWARKEHAVGHAGCVRANRGLTPPGKGSIAA